MKTMSRSFSSAQRMLNRIATRVAIGMGRSFSYWPRGADDEET